MARITSKPVRVVATRVFEVTDEFMANVRAVASQCGVVAAFVTITSRECRDGVTTTDVTVDNGDGYCVRLRFTEGE